MCESRSDAKTRPTRSKVNAHSESKRKKVNSERWGSRYRSAASRHSTALHMSIEVFGDATASHKSAEGRFKHYEWSQLIVVEKREAVKR